MGPLLLGLLVLGLGYLAIRVFTATDPKVLMKALRYSGAIVLGFAALGALAMERFGIGMLLGSMAYGLFAGGRILPIRWPYGGGRMPGGDNGGGSPRSDGVSRVRTEWVELELNHNNGEMAGTILNGEHAGKALNDLPRTVLAAFYADAASADTQTARLLEAYLDRRFGPEWRTAAGQGKHRNGDGAGAGRSGQREQNGRQSGMSRTEALRVLGLQEGAGPDAIRAAHRRLMQQYHPDRGGSDYLAAKINEAKDVLAG